MKSLNHSSSKIKSIKINKKQKKLTKLKEKNGAIFFMNLVKI